MVWSRSRRRQLRQSFRRINPQPRRGVSASLSKAGSTRGSASVRISSRVSFLSEQLFATSKLAPRYLSDEAEARLPRDLLRQMAELGLPGMRVPAAFGGTESDFVSVGIAHEEICRAHFGAGYLVLMLVLISEIVAGSVS